MPTARISSKGQVTLPAAIRRKLGIAPHSRVGIELRDDEIVIRPLKSIGELYGVFREVAEGREALPWEEERRRMEETVAREVAHE